MHGGKLKKVDLEKGSTKDITFNAFFDYQPFKEREYIFDHVWQQVKDKFYVTDLQGTDWTGYKEVYRKFLPHINNNYDFAEMLSEMLGELNASHTAPATAIAEQHLLQHRWVSSSTIRTWVTD